MGLWRGDGPPRRRRRWIAATLLVAQLLQPLLLSPRGARADAPTSWAAGFHLDERSLQAVVGQPPAPGSTAAANDLAILLWLQRFRSPASVAATWLLLDRSLAVFSNAVGAELGSGTPALKAGLDDFTAAVDTAYRGVKQIGRAHV